MKRSRYLFLVLGLLASLASPLLACTYQVQGPVYKHVGDITKALQSITPQFHFNPNSGEIKFYTKEEIAFDKVQSALNPLSKMGITLLPSKHQGHH